MTTRRAAVILMLCLAFLAAGCGGGGEPVPEASPSRSAREPGGAPVVMFLGDGFTVGERGAAGGSGNGFGAATGRLMGWQAILAGAPRSGFVATGSTGRGFVALFESQLGWRPPPDMVIVSGGHFDRFHPPAQVAAAARTLLGRIKTRWPGTEVAVIGPFWPGAAPPPGTLAVRNTLRAAARKAGVPFIDPIAERWITGDPVEGTGNARHYIVEGGAYPTPRGERYIALRLMKDLMRLKLDHPGR